MEADSHFAGASNWLARSLFSSFAEEPNKKDTRQRSRIGRKNPMDPQLKALSAELDTDINWIRSPEDRAFIQRLSLAVVKCTRDALGIPFKLTVGEWNSVDYSLTACWKGIVPWSDVKYSQYLRNMFPAKLSDIVSSCVLPTMVMLARTIIDIKKTALHDGSRVDDEDHHEYSKALGIITIVTIQILSHDSNEAMEEKLQHTATLAQQSFKRKKKTTKRK